jgi:hypothetical protein
MSKAQGQRWPRTRAGRCYVNAAMRFRASRNRAIGGSWLTGSGAAQPARSVVTGFLSAGAIASITTNLQDPNRRPSHPNAARPGPTARSAGRTPDPDRGRSRRGLPHSHRRGTRNSRPGDLRGGTRRSRRDSLASDHQWRRGRRHRKDPPGPRSGRPARDDSILVAPRSIGSLLTSPDVPAP